jgi:hypothetical protein
MNEDFIVFGKRIKAEELTKELFKENNVFLASCQKDNIAFYINENSFDKFVNFGENVSMLYYPKNVNAYFKNKNMLLGSFPEDFDYDCYIYGTRNLESNYNMLKDLN